jgi:cathepsin C
MWTMVYDEGFELTVDEWSYFAFSRFDFVTDLTGSKSAKSTCDQTLEGWYSNKARTQYGCYQSRKIGGSNSTQKMAFATTADKKAVVKHGVTSTTDENAVLSDSFHEKMVHALNQRPGASWKAKVYSRWLGKSLKELYLLQGIVRSWSRSEMREGLHRSVYLQKLRGNSSTSHEKAWDWRAVGGQNFLEPVMDQGSCGSCYAVAGMRMLSARHRIATKNPEAEPFSISYPMACSEYNQGCKGGYGFLIAKWSMDVGLIPESCAPYDAAFTCGSHLPDSCKQAKRWRAANHRYVGGFYGGTNEESMLAELYQHGPMSTGFQVQNDFMYYSEGIYSSGHDIPRDGAWVKVDHGVLMMGWGEEKGMKYWSCQNSWGPDWGEDGYFRFKRGENLGGIESISEAADVVEDEKEGKMVATFVADE